MAGASVGASPEIVNGADCVDVVKGKVVDELDSTADDLFFDVLDEQQANWMSKFKQPPVQSLGGADAKEPFTAAVAHRRSFGGRWSHRSHGVV